MKYSGHRKLLCEFSKLSKLNDSTSSDTKRTLKHLLLFTKSAQRELVSICTQSIHNRNWLSLPYILETAKEMPITIMRILAYNTSYPKTVLGPVSTVCPVPGYDVRGHGISNRMTTLPYSSTHGYRIPLFRPGEYKLWKESVCERNTWF